MHASCGKWDGLGRALVAVATECMVSAQLDAHEGESLRSGPRVSLWARGLPTDDAHDRAETNVESDGRL